MRKFLFILLICSKLTLADEVAPGETREGWSFREVRVIPVLSNGRLKPLDSYLRDSVLFMTGSRTLSGWDPVDLVFSWIIFPSVWGTKEFIQVQREDVKKQLGLDIKRNRFSPKELVHDSFLPQYVQEAQAPTPSGAKLSPREQELRRVFQRLGLYQNLISGEAWPVVPVLSPQPWKSLVGDEKEGALIRSQFKDLFTAYQSQDQKSFEKSAQTTRLAVESQIKDWSGAHSKKMILESYYNLYRPFLIAWVIYLIGLLIWLFRIERFAFMTIGLGGLVHLLGIIARCLIAGRPPVSNMYESVIWVGFGIMIFAWILFGLTRKGVLLAVASGLSALCLIAADAAPTVMDPGINPLVPVLNSNYWLTIHVLTITLSYAAFALSFGLANLSLFQYFLGYSESSSKISGLNQLCYRAMQFGVVLLAAGTILGGVWADYSWGRFWGWDPKEVWALIALLCYVIVLHARYVGWVRPFGFAAWSVLAFLSVMMAWYGVNFVLGQGLHSYGFSSGGLLWMTFFVGVQIFYVCVVTLFRIKKKA